MRGVLLAFTALAFAQEPIRVTTRLIETNVVVRDARGPIGGLTQDSFTLLEDGKPRRIAVFRVSKSSASPSKPLPPGVFSNRAHETAAQPRYKVILLDTVNTSFPHLVYARGEVIKMLERNEIRDPLAIYVMGDRFRVLQDFTTDKAKLLAAMRSFQLNLSMVNAPPRGMFRPDEGVNLTPVKASPPVAPQSRSMGAAAPSGAGVADVKDAVSMATPSEYGKFHNKMIVDTTLDTFEQLAAQLRRAPGRKSIVWITDAFDRRLLVDHTELGYNLERWRKLGSDIAIYPVFAKGLGLSDGSIDTLLWVANDTGGRAIYNTNAVADAVAQALHDDDVWYTLGFYADREKPDGHLHTLKVNVDRAGVEVRSRPDYVDEEPKTPLSDDPTTLANRVASDDFDATEIGMTATVARTVRTFIAAVKVDLKDLRLEHDGDRWKGSAYLAAVSRAASGDRLDLSIKKVDFEMSDAEYQNRMRDGFGISLTIPAKATTARIRVAIVDQSGAAGSVLLTPKN